MSLAQLLSTMSSAAFIEQYYQKLPFAESGGCRSYQHLGGWAAVERILASPGADVLVVKAGVQRPGAAPTYAAARALHGEGHTIVLRHVERRDPAIAELAAGLSRELLAALDVHIYCTPASQFGFGWHYDAEDVFILQTSGSKEYSLRKNTVNPWPLVECMPHDMSFEREIMPLMRCTLAAGDWLYIPAGYWHRARSCDDSTSVAIGAMSTTALDLYDFVRSKLVGSLVWRQRLPLATQAAGLLEAGAAEYAAVCEQLGRDLLHLWTDPRTASDFLKWRREQIGTAVGPAARASSAPAAESDAPHGPRPNKVLPPVAGLPTESQGPANP